mmetsp:Transcript_13213/g.41326  ORF Transcript_13213/g.41326 Transcript_13213/m.41326 type:complete len:231 (-) Transcript_13213:345-1037(-)
MPRPVKNVMGTQCAPPSAASSIVRSTSPVMVAADVASRRRRRAASPALVLLRRRSVECSSTTRSPSGRTVTSATNVATSGRAVDTSDSHDTAHACAPGCRPMGGKGRQPPSSWMWSVPFGKGSECAASRASTRASVSRLPEPPPSRAALIPSRHAPPVSSSLSPSSGAALSHIIQKYKSVPVRLTMVGGTASARAGRTGEGMRGVIHALLKTGMASSDGRCSGEMTTPSR